MAEETLCTLEFLYLPTEWKFSVIYTEGALVERAKIEQGNSLLKAFLLLWNVDFFGDQPVKIGITDPVYHLAVIQNFLQKSNLNS